MTIPNEPQQIGFILAALQMGAALGWLACLLLVKPHEERD